MGTALLLLALGAPATVVIPAGRYRLGADDGRYDERPAAWVRLGAFRLDATEVSNADFEAFVAAGHRPAGPWRRGAVPGAGELPARYVTWHDAAAYCAWRGGRLPTEAEWEAAAGPGRWPTGDTWRADLAVVGRGPDGAPGPVGRVFDRSPLGVHDLTGNVREWVADWYDRRAYVERARGAVVDPRGPVDGTPPERRFVDAELEAGNERSTRKVVRGGGFAAHHPDHARRARRHAHNPAQWFTDVGFRCAYGVGGAR